MGTKIPITKFQTKASKRDANKRVENDSSNYYLIRKVGYGNTSNVWHALNSDGEEVAIKMYVKNTDDDGNVLSDDIFRATAKAATSKHEAERLKSFYKCLEGTKVQNLELSGFSCVEMPFFIPVKS